MKTNARIGRHASRGRINEAIRLPDRALMLILFCSAVYAGDTVVQTETWDEPGTAGWASESGSMVLSNPGGYLNAMHGPQYIPVLVEDTAVACVTNAIRITNIAFRFRALDVPPSLVRAYIRAKESGNIWHLNLGSISDNGWHILSAPVQYSAGWFKGPSGPEEQFLEDVGDIDMVGVTIRRYSSTPAQNYAIDDFKISGLQVDGAQDPAGGQGSFGTVVFGR